MPTIVYKDDDDVERKIKVRKMRPKEFWGLQGMDQDNIQSEENYNLVKDSVQKVVMTEGVDVETLPADAFFEILLASAGGALEVSKKLSEM